MDEIRGGKLTPAVHKSVSTGSITPVPERRTSNTRRHAVVTRDQVPIERQMLAHDPGEPLTGGLPPVTLQFRGNGNPGNGHHTRLAHALYGNFLHQLVPGFAF